MKIQLVAVTAALAATVSADHLWVFFVCNDLYGCDRNSGTFTNSAGDHFVKTENGCRWTDVPNMEEFCIDWWANRLHYKWNFESNKRCMAKVLEWEVYCGDTRCYYTKFEEAPCTWREISPIDNAGIANGSTIANLSSIATPAIATTTFRPPVATTTFRAWRLNLWHMYSWAISPNVVTGQSSQCRFIRVESN
jgi:hypothetical protein